MVEWRKYLTEVELRVKNICGNFPQNNKDVDDLKNMVHVGQPAVCDA